MRSGFLACAVVGSVALGCQPTERNPNDNLSDAAGENAGGTKNAGRPGMYTAGSKNAAGGADVGDGGMGGDAVDMPDPCLGKLCDSPPASDCESVAEFRAYDKMGSCEAGECKYVSHSIACQCEEHACTTDPCEGLTCNSAPAALCKDTSTLTAYAASGVCDGGSCSYEATDNNCEFGCANGACKGDPCGGKSCNAPPAATCKDTSTVTSYAANGTCSAGECNYAGTDKACGGDTPKCKSAKCVACLANSDCQNGGTCSASNACVCSARFNGKHCEFQAFRGLGTLAGDTSSAAISISRDGRVIVGTSTPNAGDYHGFRAVDGGALQFIAAPAGAGSNSCSPNAVDGSGNVLMNCGKIYLYTPAGVASPISLPADASVADFSSDGKVLVGASGSQAFRRASGTDLLLGQLNPNGSSQFTATNGDGSLAVGFHWDVGGVALRWSAATGLVALPALAGFPYGKAYEVSTDGKVIVGFAAADAESSMGYPTVAVKWTGASYSASLLGDGAATATNGNGSVTVGRQGNPSAAMLWDSGGAHTIKALLAGTPDLDATWTLESAVAISDDGKFVVGNATHDSHGEAWVAHLP